jgi:hypothetical protein
METLSVKERNRAMNELSKVLEQVGKDKGIDRSIIVGAIEEALLTVA